ncbi:hypothetical protein JM946_26300 [Steroidobacter sp. S1-65]|uniref:DUF2946 domain-containing protein n=1 Tax=Steroidobacter gossypii TaxID=2805490 RepID=A0ABS1X4V0_9GAMM|nr:hypothetical protein [Steroidobacter gossypii]MBM0108257.1 hypothetical protein [Steroidobacter gossypii]
MRRHYFKLLSLWILPLLVARALIPAGFMLSVEAGRLQFMFCPSGVVQPLGKRMFGEVQSAEQQAHAEHHQGMHHGGDADQASPSHSQDNAPCPFSLVASAAPGAIAYVSNVDATPRDERFELPSSPTFRVGPIRTDLIRGPPSLS